MNDISKNTLLKIKYQRIIPRSRRYFLFKHSSIWVLFGISILFGSIASGVAIFQLTTAEWDLYRHLQHSLPEFVLLVMPYFWLIFLAGFSTAAYCYFRRTEGGYRYRVATVVLLSVVLSITGGTGLFAVGFSERLEAVFQETLPFYPEIADHRRKMWMRPRDGLLAGKIIEVLGKDAIRLSDLNGKKWVVDTTRATWRGRLMPTANLEIKLLGTMDGADNFSAMEIRPWQGRGKRRRMQHKDHGEP